MRGLMMDFPLTVPALLERAGKIFGKVEIVTRRPDRSLARYTWRDLYRRAHRLANACDPVSAFGGIIAANRTVTETMALQVNEVFTEVICAPDYEPAALAALKAKKNIRILRTTASNRRALEFRQICSGLLLQGGMRLGRRDIHRIPGRDDGGMRVVPRVVAGDADKNPDGH